MDGAHSADVVTGFPILFLEEEVKSEFILALKTLEVTFVELEV